MAQVTMNMSGVELALLYILTGNEDAKTILFRAIAKHLELNPPLPKKVRGRGRKSSMADVAVGNPGHVGK